MATKRKELGDAFALPPPRPRTPVAEDRAATFAESEKAPNAKQASRRRRDGIDGARVNVYVPRDVEEKLRERAFRERRSVSDAVTEAIELWLAGVAKPE